ACQEGAIGRRLCSAIKRLDRTPGGLVRRRRGRAGLTRIVPTPAPPRQGTKLLPGESGAEIWAPPTGCPGSVWTKTLAPLNTMQAGTLQPVQLGGPTVPVALSSSLKMK